MDFAVFRPETDNRLRLQGDKTGLGTEPIENPVIAIANDLFSSMAQDLFRVVDKRLEQVIPAGQEAVPVRSDHTLTLGQEKQGENHIGIDGFYADPRLNRILQAYQAQAEETRIVFPIGAFNCIQNLQALSGDKLLLLSTDRAFDTIDGQSDSWEQPYAVNGSFFSNTINYHTINRYFENEGGCSFVSRDETNGRVIAMNVLLSPKPYQLDHCRYRFHQRVRNSSVTGCLCNPEDLLDLRDDDLHNLSFKGCMALLELTAYDPDVFCRLGEKLYDALKGIDDRRLKGLLVRTLTKIRENIYLVDSEHNAYLWLGKMYYRLGLYDECLETFRQSVKLLGPDAQALYFIGACNEVKEEYEPALHYYKQSLLFDPNCRLCSDAIKRMELRLEEQATAC